MNKNFDEYQMLIRQKVAFQALILTLGMIFVNGIVKENRLWAEPLAEMVVLLLVPTAYFVTVSLFRGAYLSKREKGPAAMAALFAFLAAVTGANLFLGAGPLARDGILLNRSIQAMMTGFYSYTAAIFLVKLLIDKAASNREE